MIEREVETFITVAEQGSFLRAARERYITPASVMNQINKLEAEIGVPLLTRTNQGTQLTAAGRAFYEDAKALVAQAQQAADHARAVAEQAQQVIRIGTSILRPCKMLIDLWMQLDEDTQHLAFRIVPFEDDPASMAAMLDSLGDTIDCFVGPCDSQEWQKRCNILVLRQGPCCIAVPRKHRLAKKERLTWRDLDGETLMLVKRGSSPVLDRLRDDIEQHHPQISLRDTPHFYDTAVFNDCEQAGCLMETLDIWQDVHPSLVTLPMDWPYVMPYGVIYAKDARPAMRHLSEALQRLLQMNGGGQ